MNQKTTLITLTLLLAIAGCNANQFGVYGKQDKEINLGRYHGFEVGHQGTALLTSLGMNVSDLSPIEPRYSSYEGLITNYNLALEPLITDLGGGSYKANPNGNLKRSIFFLIIKNLLLDNWRFKYEFGEENVFKCISSSAASISGATVSDMPKTDPSFQAVQCLVNNGFAGTNGFISANTVLPDALLKRGEMVTMFHKALSLWLAKIELMPASKSCVTTVSMHNFKTFLKTLIGQLSIFPAAHAQITSVTQITDLDSGSPYFSATQELVERYGLSSFVFPDATAKLDDPATYSDIAAITEEVLNLMVSIAPSYDCPI